MEGKQGKVYHGTMKKNVEIDSEGNLILKSEFDADYGHGYGTSFTINPRGDITPPVTPESPVGYARGKTPSAEYWLRTYIEPEKGLSEKVIIEVDEAALKLDHRTGGEYRSVGKITKVPEGQYKIYSISETPAEKSSIDWSKAPEQLELWTKEVEIHEQFAESQDLAKTFDLAEFEIPRNRLDFMATDIQGQYPEKTLAEIRKDFWDIKESSQGEYADFVAELSKKYPKVRLKEKDLKQYLLKDKYNRKTKVYEWSEVDGELRLRNDYDHEGKRTVVMKPVSELDKKFGPTMIGPITKVEVKLPNVEGRMIRTYLEPFDVYKTQVIKDGEVVAIEDRPAITEEGWRNMQESLDKKGHYIISARKDDNMLIPYKYHPEAEQYAKDIEPLIKELEKAGYDDIRSDMDYDLRLEKNLYGLLTLRPEVNAAHKEVWNKKVASNFLWARDIEGAKDFVELEKRWSYDSAVAYNKRVSLMNGGEIPMRSQDFKRPGDGNKLLNKNDKLEFIFVDDDANLIKGQHREKYKDMENKNRDYTSQIDGAIELPEAIWNRVLEINGLERDVGFIKPVITAYHPQLGNMLVKSGGFKTGPIHLKLSGNNKMILWKSSVKADGLRKPDIVQYDPDAGTWKVKTKTGKPTVYEIDPKELKINLDVTESTRKATDAQSLLKQMFGYANPEQVAPVNIDAVYAKIIDRTIKGFSEFRESISEKGEKIEIEVFPYNDMVKEYFTKGTSVQRRAEIQENLYTIGRHWPDRLSREIILNDLMSKNTDSTLTRQFLKYVFERGKRGEFTGGEWAVDSQASIAEMAEMTRYEKILSAGKYRKSIWLYDQSVRPVVEKAVETYLNNRMLKPRWRDGGSGALVFYPYTVGQNLDFKLNPGEIAFKANWKSKDVRIKWTVDPKRDKIPLVDAWEQYQGALKDKSSSKEQLELMEKDLEFVVGRAPMGGLSGARVVKFRGFSKKGGWGAITHPKDDFYLGGMDKDGDSGKWFQGLPKEMVESFRKVQNDLEMPDGRSKNLKDPALDMEFGINRFEELSVAMNTKGASFMPNMRIQAGMAAFRGKRDMSVVESAKQQFQVMLSTMQAIGGERTFPVITRDGVRHGDLTVKVRTHNEITGAADSIIGDTFRFYGYNASNRTTDASNYPKMSSGQEIKKMLANKAFELSMVDAEGNKVDLSDEKSAWRLMNTELGLVAAVNQRIYGKNWLQKRSWNSEEVQDVIERLNRSELPWQGHTIRMAQDISGQFVNFDLSGTLDPAKVHKLFKDKTHSYRTPFIKELIGRMGLRIGQWNPKKGYFKGDRDNAFKLDRDVEDVVGAELVFNSGRDAYNALLRAGKTAREAKNMLDEMLRGADAIKAHAETGRRQARETNKTSAQTKYGVASRIRAERKNAIDMASIAGIEPDLLLRYWDFYFMSPLRYQTEGMQKKFKDLETQFKKDSKWFHDKFGEKLSFNKAQKVLADLPEADHKRVKGLLKQQRKMHKSFHRTDQVSMARETNEIPYERLQEYLEYKTELIESLQRTSAKAPRDLLEEGVQRPQEAEKEASDLADRVVASVKETPLNEWEPRYERIKKYGLKAEETLDAETIFEMDKLVEHLKEPKNKMIKDSFAEFFAQFTFEGEAGPKAGRPLESLTPSDIKHLNAFFDLANSREFLLKYYEDNKGNLTPIPSKWMHHSLYGKVGDHAFVADRKLIGKYGIPLQKANGDLIFVRGKQPVSAMSHLTDIGQTVIRHRDKFVSMEQQYRDTEVTGLLLDETVVKDSLPLFEIAVTKYLRHGSGTEMSTADRAYYKKMFADKQSDFKKLMEKGKTYRYKVKVKDKKTGKEVVKDKYLDADEFTDIIIKNNREYFDRLYKKWIDPFPNDAEFERQFSYDNQGKLKDNVYRDMTRGVTEARESIEGLDIKGTRTEFRIENERVMEEILSDDITFIANKYDPLIDASTGKQKEEYKRKKSKRERELRESFRRNFQSSDSSERVGEIPVYWPQLGHMSVKANRPAVLEHLQTKLEDRFQSVYDYPEQYLSSSNLVSYHLGLAGKPGGKTIEELASIEAHLLDSRLQRFVLQDVMKDGGNTEQMVRLMEKHTAGKSLSGTTQDNAYSQARELGFFQKPGSFMARGKDFMPHFRTDADVMKIYSERLIATYFNHLFALQSQDLVSSFTKRDPMGKGDSVSADGKPIKVDLTKKWADIMRDISRNILGYPTLFSTEPGDPHATFIGHSKRMMKAYARTLQTKTMNKLSRDKINSHLVAKGLDPVPTFKTKEEEQEWMRSHQVYIKILKNALSKETNPLQVYGSGYYYTSDTAMVNMIMKVGEKFAGRDANGNVKLPWKNLPSDPAARRMALTSMVHKLGSFEAKWSLATLLTHPKTAIGNMFCGSMNTITNTSFRHWKDAGNMQYLLRNVFKDAKLSDGTSINDRVTISRALEELGVLEAFYIQELGLDPTFTQPNRNAFMKAVVKRMAQRGLFKAGVKDVEIKETIGELAQKYKINEWVASKAAYFMRISEKPIRQRAFLAHYLNAREALHPLGEELAWNSDWLISYALKGVTATQFLYHAAARSNYSNTAIGKVMTRFQPFAWNSIAFRKHVYRSAKIHGFTPGTKDFERLRRQLSIDSFVFALGNVFASSIFEYAMAPPMSWLQDTSQFFFGEERERERAFFSQWPVISKRNILAPLQPVTAPILRYPLNTIALFTEGGLDKFSTYYMWTWFPFGRIARDLKKTIQSPAMIVENVTGFPLHSVHSKSRSLYKDWGPEEDNETEIPDNIYAQNIRAFGAG
jgi:hypothetical protein